MLEALIGYGTGLRLVAGDMPMADLLATALVVNICNAVMCRLFAYNNGYPRNTWTLLGLLFGVWAVGVLIILPRRRTKV